MLQLILTASDFGPPGGVPAGVKVIGIAVIALLVGLALFGRGKKH